MRSKFDEQLKQLHIDLLDMAYLIQDAIQNAMIYFFEADINGAKKIIKNEAENNSEIKQVTFGVNKTCKNALEAFEIKTQYERFQLLTLKTLKNPAEESFKALKAVKG